MPEPVTGGSTPQLPGAEVPLDRRLSQRIPKIVIGNPGPQDRLAWDLIPNWRPRLTPGVQLTDGDIVRYGDELLRPPGALVELLRCCDGRTFWDVCGGLAQQHPESTLESVVEGAAAQVKAGRVLGLLHWHFRCDNADGTLLRRRELGSGVAGHGWYYLPPFTKDVFDLCSGAYSCREIADALAATTGRTATELLRPVVRSVRTLIGIGVVDWVDDVTLRDQRRAAFASPGQSPAGTLPVGRKGALHAHD